MPISQVRAWLCCTNRCFRENRQTRKPESRRGGIASAASTQPCRPWIPVFESVDLLGFLRASRAWAPSSRIFAGRGNRHGLSRRSKRSVPSPWPSPACNAGEGTHARTTQTRTRPRKSTDSFAGMATQSLRTINTCGTTNIRRLHGYTSRNSAGLSRLGGTRGSCA